MQKVLCNRVVHMLMGLIALAKGLNMFVLAVRLQFGNWCFREKNIHMVDP
jgi:ABC-type antimicrobial peptide transport system ATPase subunit